LLTIKDIAKIAKVSPATVSRVINNSGYVKLETRTSVEDAIRENGYVPNVLARNLSKNETNTIGVVVPDINNPFFGEVIKGITMKAEKSNLNILLCDTNEREENERRSLKMLKGQKLKGIIITPTSDANEFNAEYLKFMESIGIPIVLVDRDVKHSKFDGVFIDNIAGTFEGMQALIQNGHRRIAIIAGPKTSKPGRDRLRGYKQALEAYQIPLDESLIFYGDFKLKSGYEITKKIFDLSPLPTAIFSSNNMMTLGCIKYLNEAGKKIGEDISLLGFDEIEMLNILNIKISVIDRPTYSMGEVAITLLMEKLESGKNTDNIQRTILMPKLILRGSEKLKGLS